jgi:hypothetical protein
MRSLEGPEVVGVGRGEEEIGSLERRRAAICLRYLAGEPGRGRRRAVVCGVGRCKPRRLGAVRAWSWAPGRGNGRGCAVGLVSVEAAREASRLQAGGTETDRFCASGHRVRRGSEATAGRWRAVAARCLRRRRSPASLRSARLAVPARRFAVLAMVLRVVTDADACCSARKRSAFVDRRCQLAARDAPPHRHRRATLACSFRSARPAQHRPVRSLTTVLGIVNDTLARRSARKRLPLASPSH